MMLSTLVPPIASVQRSWPCPGRIRLHGVNGVNVYTTTWDCIPVALRGEDGSDTGWEAEVTTWIRRVGSFEAWTFTPT